MVRTRSSSNGTPDDVDDTVASIAARKKSKKASAQKKKRGRPSKKAKVSPVEREDEAEQFEHEGQETHNPTPATGPVPMVITPELNQMFNTVTSAAEMFQAFLANQNQTMDQTSPRATRQGKFESSRTSEFLKLNPPVYYGSKKGEDPMEWLAEVKKALKTMKACDSDAVELAAFQLKDVAGSWFELWEGDRDQNYGPPTWEEFEDAFLEEFISEEEREAKAMEFEQLKQGSKSVEDYYIEFRRLARFAPKMVDTSRAMIRRFVNGLGSHIRAHTKTVAMGQNVFSEVVGFAKNLEKDQQKVREEKDRYLNKRARSIGGFSGTAGGGNSSYNRANSAPIRSTFQSGGESFFRKNQNFGSRSHQNQKFQHSVSQSQGSVAQQPHQNLCSNCKRSHSGQCQLGFLGCYHCGESDHIKPNCPRLRRNFNEGSTHPLNSSASAVAPPRTFQNQGGREAGRGRGRGVGPANQGVGRPHFYAAIDRQSAEASPAVVTGTSFADKQATG